MDIFKSRRLAITVLVVAGLVLAACTRSASTGPVPTAVPPTIAGGTDDVGGGAVEVDPTMAALGTQVASQMTATALAMGVGGGDGEIPTDTPPPVETTPQPTATSAIAVAPTATPVPAAACSSPYTVKQGDWIYKIARDCKVDPRGIIAANPGINPDFIRPGQQLNLPGETAAPSAACTGTHTVVQGENLFRLAYNCGLTTEQLAAHNGIAFPYTIHPGDVIRFP